MKNFEYYEHTSKNNQSHWEYCDQYKLPYICIKNYNHKYNEIFYDVTNLGWDLEKVSEKMRCFYKNYIEFFCIDEPFFHEQLFQDYFFNIYVYKEHTETIANQLFLYFNENADVFY